MDVAADAGFRRSPGWLVVLALLLATQGWLTLRLFGPGLPIERMTNDEPVINGRHPLHSYHGLLGNRSWHERQTITCYDPAFQAGYLKTPVFDAGSRPAELFFLIGGPAPGSYKIGLAVCCLLVPWAFALAARGVGLGPGASCVAAGIGLTLWWSPACHALLDGGDIDVLVGGMCVPVYLAWLARYSRMPGPTEWLVLTGSAAVGWYMQPLLMLGVVPVVILYQFWVLRTVRLAWHLGLFSANVLALGVNGFWLWEWGTHIWMYVPYGGEDCPHGLCPATLREWEAFLPSDAVDLAAAAIGLVGLMTMLRRHAVAATLTGLGILIYVAAGGAGRLWPIFGEVGAQKAMSVAVWCCAVPCAYGLMSVAGGMGSSSRVRPIGLVWLAIGLAGLTYALDVPRRWDVEPLEIGLGPERKQIVQTIRERSTPDGRILWEDLADEARSSGWTALLPELTQRPFLGGLAPEVSIDYQHTRLADGKLVGRPIDQWNDEELTQFFERYNVTRVICRTPESTVRFRLLRGAAVVAEFRDEAGVMFALDRRPSYVLKGRATVTQMDWKRVALSDIEPDEEGVVVLSLHHHANWSVSPGYVVIERDVDVTDPVPMIRLRVPGPVTRLTMTWKGE